MDRSPISGKEAEHFETSGNHIGMTLQNGAEFLLLGDTSDDTKDLGKNFASFLCRELLGPCQKRDEKMGEGSRVGGSTGEVDQVGDPFSFGKDEGPKEREEVGLLVVVDIGKRSKGNGHIGEGNDFFFWPVLVFMVVLREREGGLEALKKDLATLKRGRLKNSHKEECNNNHNNK